MMKMMTMMKMTWANRTTMISVAKRITKNTSVVEDYNDNSDEDKKKGMKQITK